MQTQTCEKLGQVLQRNLYREKLADRLSVVHMPWPIMKTSQKIS